MNGLLFFLFVFITILFMIVFLMLLAGFTAEKFEETLDRLRGKKDIEVKE